MQAGKPALLSPVSLTAVDPHAEYTRRLEERRKVAAFEDRRYRRIGNARLATGIVGAIMAWLVFGNAVLPFWWLAFPVAIFLALVLWHQYNANRLNDARRAVLFYECGLARLEDRWQGQGDAGERFRPADHLYADDLDIFGRGSMFELMSTARTVAGQETLAKWLLEPAEIGAVRDRQEAVEELRGRLDLRADLFLLGDAVRTPADTALLDGWGKAEPVEFTRALWFAAPAMAATAIALFVLYVFDVLRLWPFLVAVLVELGLIYALRPKVHRVTESVEQPAAALELVSAVLERFEREQFTSALLLRLAAGFEAADMPASRRIAQLERYVFRVEWTDNQFFAPIAAVLLWREQLAIRIERWRRENGARAGVWLSTVGELEALSALAGYAFEHPSDPFPELAKDGPLFAAEGLAHPLLKESAAVRNDVRLGPGVRLLIISGSNMSGKSTLLRAVGLNAALAMCGAPVRAARLATSALSVAASIRVLDSLQDGRSRFLAEITRMRRMMELAESGRALLFLIDELLSGTNSHDRRIGAEAILRGLLARGAIGMATTHDLALAAIADVLAPIAQNVHFADVLDEGKLTFDYRLHHGVVRRGNALELMRSVGLEV